MALRNRGAHILGGRLNAEKQDSADAASGHGQPSTLADALEIMTSAWAAGLRGRKADPHAEYWKLGINVNRALDIVRELWLKTGIDIPTNLFVEAPTISLMAARLHDGTGLQPRDIVKLRDGDAGTPLFVFTGGTGLLLEYTDLVRQLDYRGAIYGIPLAGMNGKSPYSETVHEEAEHAVRLMRGVQHSGPFRLMGYSSGGCVTLEAARLLRSEHLPVAFLGLLDSGLTDHHWPLRVWLRYMIPEAVTALRKRLVRGRGRDVRGVNREPRPDLMPRRRGTRYEFRFRNPDTPGYHSYSPYWRGDLTPRDGLTRAHSLRMWGRYRPLPYDGPVAFFVAQGSNPISCPPTAYWSNYLPRVEWIPVPGNHITMMVGRHAARLADAIGDRLRG
jgi:thioesterase domain-containing protein